MRIPFGCGRNSSAGRRVHTRGTLRDGHRKIAQYLAAGTSVVWVLDPESVTVNVYEKLGVFRTLAADDLIDAPELLPGFSIPVRTLFE